ncbi:DUF2264 domain-containing protein [Actinotalea sp. BY-33]|uniref:DUF2264 domain-containing protein n=1 Tax=Actinotalea soli TaxID=2819234 RepID=A0A939RV67_9CELL|nr:DUF2264 domain-containing protein [Actinotalea soli]MBO1751313.1 DUF2264 domain-containing protein [Actinotalea soli]
MRVEGIGSASSLPAASTTPSRSASSPLTGWDRTRWASLADDLLTAVRPYASPDHARIELPGPAGGYGRDVDGLEGFARTFLLAGFRMAGERGADPRGDAQWYAEGLAAGTDPHAPGRWPRLSEHAQAKVEAASLALVLDLTRPWLWDGLAPLVQEQLVDYLAVAVGDDTYPRINWVWFRLVVQTFLRSVGAPHSLTEMQEDLATHDGFVREDGWLADGDQRSFDHYSGWALHLYPTLWARMRGAEDLAAPRRERDVQLLDRYLRDALALVGADGSPLLQGRSLTYRFAAAAPFWVGAMAQVPSSSLGELRRAASGVLSHFVEHGAPDHRGLLTQGWHHEWPAISQTYTGPGSPYWASKGLLGLALPADHPAWTAVEEPLPVERGDQLRAVRAPGWIVSGTRADGVVRVVNHGTDHAQEGDVVGDAPLYARLGYSTATSPLTDPASKASPSDQGAVLVDHAGRATHRAGWRALGARIDTTEGQVPVGVAASTAQARWLAPGPEPRDHGSGLDGTFTEAGTLTTVSLVRGPWEVRLCRVDQLAAGLDPEALRLRLSGWPTVPGDGLHSAVLPLLGAARAGSVHRAEASMLGPAAEVPWVETAVRPGTWVAALVTLERPRPAPGPTRVPRPTATLELTAADRTAAVHWPDGERTRTALP